MNQLLLPRLVEAGELLHKIDDDKLLLVDLCDRPQHLPGAVHLDFSLIIANRLPAMGLLPDAAQLAEVLASLGAKPEHHIVAYDNDGGSKACRFLWTLDVVGHQRYSLLDGGTQAWISHHFPVNTRTTYSERSQYPVHLDPGPIADREYIQRRLHDPDTVILDVRTPAEYEGSDKRAARAGHIPGAINIEWTQAIDRDRNTQLRPMQELTRLYSDAGVTPDKEVITYCHTHRRSAHSYFVLKWLGYPRVRAYPGSWSDWGNREDTPIE